MITILINDTKINEKRIIDLAKYCLENMIFHTSLTYEYELFLNIKENMFEVLDQNNKQIILGEIS